MPLDDVLHDDAAPAAQPAKTHRGFRTMHPERQRQIASQGGRMAHLKGTAHEWDSTGAARAGGKGGAKVSQNREHMAEIGRRGGKKRGENIAARKAAERAE